MSKTGDQLLWTGTANQILDAFGFRNYLVDYFDHSIFEWFEAMFPTAGWFGEVEIAADGNNKFKLQGYLDISGVSQGRILALSESPTDVQGIQFANENAQDYDVACKRVGLLQGIQVNPKDGLPNWLRVMDVVGDSGSPDSVADNGNGTLTAVVDGITEAGVSNAGRTVKILQISPAAGATSEAIALEECTVTWDGSNNKITTVGDLGQDTISTTASDYYVVLVGPRVMEAPSSLQTDADYAYVGTVTGAGAGNPPTTFDITGQTQLTLSTADFWQFLRIEDVPPERWKIDVKAIAAEENTNTSQMRVTGWDGVGGQTTVFDVDELGNVTIKGDLEVQGETTQQDVVTVNSDEIITDSLTVGDADADAHEVKGTWRHRNQGETETWFVVDGAQGGKIGIGTTASSSYQLNVGGDVQVTGDLDFIGDLTVDGDILPASTNDLGDSGKEWDNIYCNTIYCSTLALTGHLLPAADDTYDLGESSTPLEWRNIYIDGTAYLDTVELGTGTGEGINTHVEPAVTDTYRLGYNRRWERIWALYGSFESVSATGASAGDGYISIQDDTPMLYFHDDDASAVNEQKYWRIGLFTNGVMEFRSYNDDNVAYYTFLQAEKESTTEDIADLYLTAEDSVQIEAADSAGYVEISGGSYIDLLTSAGSRLVRCEGDIVPKTTQGWSLGTTTNQWKYLWLSSAAGEGCYTGFMPVSDGAFPLGSFSTVTETGYRWSILHSEAALISNPSDAVLFLFHEGESADEGLWGIRVRGADGDLQVCSYSDAQASGTVALEFVRGTGNTCDEIVCGVDFLPLSNQSIGDATHEWRYGYFSENILAKDFLADGDSGALGGAGTVQYTGKTTSGSGATGTVANAGGNSSAGWITIYVAGAIAYIPYWSAVT